MISNELLIDAFGRIQEVVHQTIKGLNQEDLAFRPTETANSIGWLVWHLTRIQDDHVANIAHTQQAWHSEWSKKFALPFADDETGYGHSSKQVAAVQVQADLLLDYYDAVHAATIAYIQSLQDEDYEKIVDTRWNPPVTLAVRLISVIADDLQHAGQAAYVRGLLNTRKK
ncbi:mycothiol transferase [Ktedonospora formicarum]|uniref:DUF664 domain-containing protein n=1 Tax=Ktedonospora formicarum TaxID=2778364 RepID=A0A8J3I369_9CHLR|nr:DUF664 domain-containing protein [Ktedonospora formicarum]GHO45878.1 hypothetical protein KSX_40410 [Ktedonospora formicarum]